MPRTIIAPRLGVGGRNTDKPTWTLDPSETQDAQDAIIVEGALKRRRGFTAASVSGLFSRSVYRATFPINGVTATFATAFYGAALSPFEYYPTNSNPFNPEEIITNADLLPRAVYNGELLFCYQDGKAPMWRVVGLGPGQSAVGSGTSAAYTVGKSIVTLTAPMSVRRGQFFRMWRTVGATNAPWPVLYFKHVGADALSPVTSSTITVEGIKTSTAPASLQIDDTHGGLAYPCVAIYDSGTASVTSGSSTVTGVGTSWSSTALDAQIGASPLFPPAIMFTPVGAAARVWGWDYGVVAVTDTTFGLIGTAPATITDSSYTLLSSCPFKDVCVHNETLYGVGVAQHPNRVYIAPPGWNMSFPPGAILPFDPSIEFTSTNPDDFLLDFVDVPNDQDGDAIVAILETDGPRLVLKQNSVWGLYNEPPLLTPHLLHAGDGCIDIRSAISTSRGAFFAGSDGIYHYFNGSFRDLTTGRMNNEWRAITSAGINYCSIGFEGSHVVVAIKTADPFAARYTFLYDLDYNTWTSRMTNVCPQYQFTSNLPGEPVQLLALDPQHSYFLDLRPALDTTGPARDVSGTGPNFLVETGDSFTQAEGIEGEVRAVELSLHTVVQDESGSSTLNVKALHGGSLRGTSNGEGVYYDAGVNWDSGAFWGPDGCRNLGNIASTTHGEAVRNEWAINRTARRLRLRIEETTVSTTVGEVALGEAVVRVKDLRRGS